MTQVSDEDRALAGEYALGLLDGAELQNFEARLNRDPELRDAFAMWAEDFALMNDEGEAPPAALKARIDRTIFGAPRRTPGWLWGMGTAVAATLATVVFLNMQTPVADYTAAIEQDQLVIQAKVYLASGTLELPVLMSTPPADRSHELWLIPEGGAPVSLGVLANGTIKLPDDINLAGALIAVSIEQIGGSPSGAPTTTPIAVVPLTPA